MGTSQTKSHTYADNAAVHPRKEQATGITQNAGYRHNETNIILSHSLFFFNVATIPSPFLPHFTWTTRLLCGAMLIHVATELCIPRYCRLGIALDAILGSSIEVWTWQPLNHKVTCLKCLKAFELRMSAGQRIFILQDAHSQPFLLPSLSLHIQHDAWKQDSISTRN